MTALSNMPEASKMTFPNGMTKTSFMATPRMSTYLLCFVVGEFDHVSKTTSNGVLIRAFTPPGKPHLGEFALDCAVAALDAYESRAHIFHATSLSGRPQVADAAKIIENGLRLTERGQRRYDRTFEIPYPLPKSDMVGRSAPKPSREA